MKKVMPSFSWGRRCHKLLKRKITMQLTFVSFFFINYLSLIIFFCQLFTLHISFCEFFSLSEILFTFQLTKERTCKKSADTLKSKIYLFSLQRVICKPMTDTVFTFEGWPMSLCLAFKPFQIQSRKFLKLLTVIWMNLCLKFLCGRKLFPSTVYIH